MTQLVMPLEDRRDAIGKARHTDPATSKTAASKVVKQSPLMDRIAACLRSHPAGLTDEELIAELDLPPRLWGSAKKRRRDTGAVDTGLRRPTATGRSATVWRLT